MPRNLIKGASRAAFVAASISAYLAAQGGPTYAPGSAEDNAEFAKVLAQRGYFDLAKDVAKEAQSGATTPAAKAAIDYVFADISADEAQRTSSSDMNKRLDALDGAIKSLEEFLTKYGSAKEVAEVRFRIGELSRLAGEGIGTLLKAENDATKKEALRERGKGYFTKAIDAAEKRIKDAEAKNELENPVVADEIVALRYSLCRYYWLRSQLHENKQGVDSKADVAKALEAFENFEIECPSDRPIFFKSREFYTEVLVYDGKVKEAVDIMQNSCTTLGEAVEGDRSIVRDEVIRDVIASAHYTLAKLQATNLQPPQADAAIATLESMQKLLPNAAESVDGRKALLLLAETLLGEGRVDKAKPVAKLVYDKDNGGPSGLRAEEILQKLEGSKFMAAGGAGLVKALEQRRAEKDVLGGEKLLTRILSGRDGLKMEDRAEALFQMGFLYYETGRVIDASVCFNIVSTDFGTSPRAPEAKFNEATCYGSQAKISGGNYWKDQFKNAREDLIKKFPNSSQARDAVYFVAVEKNDQQQWAEAIDLFAKVPETSARYGEAQFKAGVAATELGNAAFLRNNEAEGKKWFAAAEKYLTASRTALLKNVEETLNEAEKKRLRNQAVDSQLRLVAIYLKPQMNGADKCIELLNQLEKDVAGDKDNIAKVWRSKIRAYTALGKGREAVGLFSQWVKNSKDVGNVADIALNVASTADGEANERYTRDAKDKEAVELWRQAAELYRLSVSEATKSPPASRAAYGKVGSRLLFISNVLLRGTANSVAIADIDPAVPLKDKQDVEAAVKAFVIADSDAATGGKVDVERSRGAATAYALLGNWEEAITSLQKVSDANKLFADDGKLDDTVQKQVPGILFVFQDLAVAYLRAGKQSGNKNYFQQAILLTTRMRANSVVESELYWQNTYLNLLARLEAGEKGDVELRLDTMEREAPNVDGDKFGIKTKINELRKRVNKKPLP